MARKSLQKNLSYDEQRDLYYVTLQKSGLRQSRTYHTYRAALEALYPGLSRCAGTSRKPIPTPSATLGQWLDWWLTEDVTPSRAVSTAYG